MQTCQSLLLQKKIMSAEDTFLSSSSSDRSEEEEKSLFLRNDEERLANELSFFYPNFFPTRSARNEEKRTKKDGKLTKEKKQNTRISRYQTKRNS